MAWIDKEIKEIYKYFEIPDERTITTISDCLETIKPGISYAQKLGCMAFTSDDAIKESSETSEKTLAPIQKQTNVSFSISNYKVDSNKLVKGITEVITPDWIVGDSKVYFFRFTRVYFWIKR